MKSEAIISLNPSVVNVIEEGGVYTAFDVNGNEVSFDNAAVDAKAAELVADYKLEQLRKKRNAMLAETDHWVLSDTADATSEQLAYRQALRDITNTYSSLDDVVFPEKP